MLQRLKNVWHLYRIAARDPRTPMMAKAMPFAALLYLLWPLDVIPDFLPILGQADDIGMILLLSWLAIRLIPDEVKNSVKRRIIDVDPK
jgi:uncharacterized membrane protein YkvA (DUF1232 family)